MNIEFEIYRKFPAKPLELKIQPPKKYADCVFVNLRRAKLYMTVTGELVISENKFFSGQIITLKNVVRRNFKLKTIFYKRTSNDYKNEMFYHNFNTKELLYTCNYKNNLVYFIRGKKPLYEVKED